MKKRIVIVVFIVLLLFIFQAEGAEYVVKRGDTLTKIARTTKHSILELMIMNKINLGDIDSIKVGQKVIFISLQDEVRASCWCFLQIAFLEANLKKPDISENYKYYKKACDDIEKRRFRYSDGESGIDFNRALNYAKAWNLIVPDLKKLFANDREKKL